MNVQCSIADSHLALDFEDYRAIIINGVYHELSNSLCVKKKDLYENEDMIEQEKRDVIKAIEAYNTKHSNKIILV